MQLAEVVLWGNADEYRRMFTRLAPDHFRSGA